MTALYQVIFEFFQWPNDDPETLAMTYIISRSSHHLYPAKTNTAWLFHGLKVIARQSGAWLRCQCEGCCNQFHAFTAQPLLDLWPQFENPVVTSRFSVSAERRCKKISCRFFLILTRPFLWRSHGQLNSMLFVCVSLWSTRCDQPGSVPHYCCVVQPSWIITYLRTNIMGNIRDIYKEKESNKT